jgi:hypothetical protein
MTCERGTVDNIYFVRWIVPEVTDSEAIIEDVRRLHTERGEKLRYVAIIGERVDPPGDDVRSSMKRNIDDLLTYCESVHLVIEGRGFRRAMARSIGTSIFLLSRNRGRTFAHDTVEHALERIGVASVAIPSVLARAREQGLLTS